MTVWEVLNAQSEQVGTIIAPDNEMALLFARNAFFRRCENETFAVRPRGSSVIIWTDEPVQSSVDRSYRKPEGYAGVGARYNVVRSALRKRGIPAITPATHP